MGIAVEHRHCPIRVKNMGSDDMQEPLAGEEPVEDELAEEPENPNKAREAFLYCLLGVCFSIGVSVWIRYDQSDEAMMEFYAGYMVGCRSRSITCLPSTSSSSTSRCTPKPHRTACSSGVSLGPSCFAARWSLWVRPSSIHSDRYS